MPIQKRLAQVAIAKQTAKGTAAGTGTYQFGVTGGRVISAEVQEDDLPITWSDRLLAGHDRTGVIPGASLEVVALPKMIGLLLYGACGAITSTPGTPNSHSIVSANDLPYLTMFGRQGSEYFKVEDAKVASLSLSWDRVGKLRASASFMGIDLSFLGAAYTASTDEKLTGGALSGNGQTFEIDGAAATVKSGSIQIENGLEAVFGSDSVQPADVFPGTQTIGVSLTVVPDDLEHFRYVITGAAAGTTVSASPFYTTATCAWALDADTDLTFTANRLRALTEFPDADPAGGPVEVVIEGAISQATSGEAYEFVLRNDVASY